MLIKRVSLKIICIFLFAIFIPFNILAEIGISGGAAPFLRIGVGARALSLSGAFTAYSDDSTVSYWNPAAITNIKFISISSMLSWLSDDRSYTFINAIIPTDIGSFALNLINFSIDGIEGRNSDTQEFYTFSDTETAIFLTYGKKITEIVSIGGNIKLININLFSEGANGISLDMGLLLEPMDILSIGVVFQDVINAIGWTTGYNENIPYTMRLGVLLNIINEDLKISLDAEQVESEEVTLKTGTEL